MVVILSVAKEPKLFESPAFSKIVPIRIKCLNQLQLPLPGPAFDLFLTTDSCLYVARSFAVHQALGFVLGGVAIWLETRPMLGNSSPQIAGDSHVKLP